MAYPVYSARLWAGTVGVPSNRILAFTVPAGKRVIVRSVCCSANPADGSRLVLYLGTGGPELLRVSTDTAHSGVGVVETHVVYHEGEGCYVQVWVGTHNVCLCGYVLEGAGAPGVPGTLPA